MVSHFIKPAGYGAFLWPNDPLSSRDLGVLEATESALDEDLWDTLLEAGYTTVQHLTIDGIPYLFTERELVDVYGDDVRAPPDYTICPALSIDDALERSIDCDREQGLAAGRSIDLLLAAQVLEDEGVAASLFRLPSVQTPVTTSITSAATTSIPVESTSGFTAGAKVYLGHECLEPQTLSTTSLEGVRRAVCGPAHYHTSQTGSGYRYVTDAPMFWRGRLVTLWEQLVSPEGRALGGTLARVGPYVRQCWKGYLDDEPKATEYGIVLRALPLPRLLAEEVGVKVRGEVNFDSNGFPYPLGLGGSDIIRVQEDAGSGLDVQGPDDPEDVSLTSLATWCALATANIRTRAGPDLIKVEPVREGWHVRVRARFAGETSHTFTAVAGAWFLGGWIHRGEGNSAVAEARIPLDFNAFGRTTWLPIRFEASEDGSAADVPQSGTGVLEVDGRRETVSWSEVRRIAGADESEPVALMITSRSPWRTVGGDIRTLDWSRGGTLTIVAGARGSWSEVFRTIVTSSGLSGTRGPLDSLGFGFGYGLSEEHLDLASLELVGGNELEAFAEGKASVAKMLLGWCALLRLCVVQRRGRDGVVRLAVVRTDPAETAGATVLGRADVLLDGHKKPEKLQAPNQIEIEAGTGSESRKYIPRDRARQQAEKVVRSWSIKAPGCSETQAVMFAGGLMRLADGQEAVELEVPPWVRLQCGDAVDLETEHPGTYDWRTGARAPSSIPAVVVGVGDRRRVRRLTLLLAGQAADSYLLAPSPLLTHYVPTATFRLANADAVWFEVGDEVYLYDPGVAAIQATITSKDEGETETAFAVDAAFGGTVGTTRITIAKYTDDVARQRRFMFVRDDRFWR